MRRDFKRQMEEDNLCAICMKRKVSANIDCCSHQFCHTCIKDWVKGESKSCPLCRRDVSELTSIRTGATLYRVRRQEDHAQFHRESDYESSSMSGEQYLSDSEEYQEQSSVLSGILEYFGYSSASVIQEDESQQQSSFEYEKQQKSGRKKQQGVKNQKKNVRQQKPVKSAAQKKKKVLKQEQKEIKREPSAFQKKPKNEQKKPGRQDGLSEQIQRAPKKAPIQTQKSNTKGAVQKDLYKVERRQQNPFQEVIDKYTQLQNERIAARKKPQKTISAADQYIKEEPRFQTKLPQKKAARQNQTFLINPRIIQIQQSQRRIYVQPMRYEENDYYFEDEKQAMLKKADRRNLESEQIKRMRGEYEQKLRYYEEKEKTEKVQKVFNDIFTPRNTPTTQQPSTIKPKTQIEQQNNKQKKQHSWCEIVICLALICCCGGILKK